MNKICTLGLMCARFQTSQLDDYIDNKGLTGESGLKSSIYALGDNLMISLRCVFKLGLVVVVIVVAVTFNNVMVIIIKEKIKVQTNCLVSFHLIKVFDKLCVPPSPSPSSSS